MAFDPVRAQRPPVFGPALPNLILDLHQASTNSTNRFDAVMMEIDDDENFAPATESEMRMADILRTLQI